MFEDSFRGLADLVLPGTSYLERDGTTINLEGRLQRQRRAVLAPVPGRARLDRRSSPSASTSSSRRTPRSSSTRSPSAASAASRSARSASVHRSRRAPSRVPREAAAAATRPGTGRRACASSPTGRSSPAPPSSARRSCSSSGPPARSQLSRDDANARKIRNGQAVTVSSNGTSVELRARIARDLAAGTVRIAQADAGDLHAARRGDGRDARAVVDRADQGADRDQRRDGVLRRTRRGSSASCSGGCSTATARTAPARRASSSRSPTCSS